MLRIQVRLELKDKSTKVLVLRGYDGTGTGTGTATTTTTIAIAIAPHHCASKRVPGIVYKRIKEELHSEVCHGAAKEDRA
jgi:hypothetical protein